MIQRFYISPCSSLKPKKQFAGFPLKIVHSHVYLKSFHRGPIDKRFDTKLGFSEATCINTSREIIPLFQHQRVKIDTKSDTE